MPPNIKKAEEIKISINDKANVIEQDDEADVEERPTEPDLCFDVDPDERFYGDGEGVQLAANTTAGGAANEGSFGTDESVAHESIGPSCSSNLGEFKELLASPLTLTANSSQILQQQSARVLSAKPTSTPSRTIRIVWEVRTSLRFGGRYVSKHPKEAPPMLLATFRDTIGIKRGNEDDKETQETSFAKAQRIRAMRTTTALKAKLTVLETSASSMGGSLLEMLILLREENERKAEERRVIEERRCHEDFIAQKARLRAEKAEAEERRRQEKIERDERARRDREEARPHTQELVMLIGALTKKS
ncbi:unnamed protein product [Phytophthora fragariaefolia]|uniref:Unnamed protein product n=1 Tax=Phytophthora fragariaefolia TaxID=1490495 RepID=A0A9W6XMH3_9STRA|nr:unnamed protein product [Phytophthora fragariaefolia]